jgi:hypothetical protein
VAPAASRSGATAPFCSKLSFFAPPDRERLGIPFAFDPGPGTLSMEAIAAGLQSCARGGSP